MILAVLACALVLNACGSADDRDYSNAPTYDSSGTAGEEPNYSGAAADDTDDLGGISTDHAEPGTAGPDPDYCMRATGEAIDQANAAQDYSAAGTESRMPEECVAAGY